MSREPAVAERAEEMVVERVGKEVQEERADPAATMVETVVMVGARRCM